MNPLITANQLQERLNRGANVLICDCRFDLAQVSAGREAYEKATFPAPFMSIWIPIYPAAKPARMDATRCRIPMIGQG
jgi:hypothetical protein